ncbi:MAG: branched-chain amino acid ABC transporter permease [Syntrophorhabdales bacterium]|jgi:branched-chain amino acid transport system permease protein
MHFVLIQMFNGISLGAILFILSSGFSLIFGIMKVVNIAHGSFYMLGGYIGLSLMTWTKSLTLAMAGAALSVGMLGIVLERNFLARFHLQELPQIMITTGLALVFRDVAFLLWGGDPYSFPIPRLLQGTFSFGDLTITIYRVFAVVVAVVVAFGLWLFIEKTIVGAKLRACIDDKQMAGGMGINVSVFSALMFALGAALAAFGGVMAGPFFGVFPGSDFEILPFAFVVVILGGMGSLKGAAVGSLIVGLIDTFGKALFPDLSYFTLFAPMAIMLAIRPTGLFGRPDK